MRIERTTTCNYRPEASEIPRGQCFEHNGGILMRIWKTGRLAFEVNCIAAVDLATGDVHAVPKEHPVRPVAAVVKVEQVL